MESLTKEKSQYLVNAFVYAIRGRAGDMDNLGLYVYIRYRHMLGEDWAGYDPNQSKAINRIAHNFLYHLASTEEVQDALNALNDLLNRSGFAMREKKYHSYIVVPYRSVRGIIGERMPKNFKE